jgi:hypothetical protein
MDEVGSPATLLGVLGDLGHAWADPVASVLALIAFITEALVAYMLVVLLLHSLCLLPGFMGRLAGRLMALVTRWWSGACSTCSSGAHCSPSWPWRRHRVRRPAIDGLVRPWRRPRPCPSAVLSVQPPRAAWARRAPGQDGVAGRWMRRSRPERGPPPAGQRRHCRPGWGRAVQRPCRAQGQGRRPGAQAEQRDPGPPGAQARQQGRRRDGAPARGQGRRPRDLGVHRPGGRHPVGHRGGPAPADRAVGGQHRPVLAQIYRANRPVIGADPDLIRPGTRLDVPSFRVR